MITAETIASAEKLLSLVADGMDIPGQFARYQVDQQAYENFHQEMMGLVIQRMQQGRMQFPRRAIPVINTIMAHHFLVGVACGRMTVPEESK